MAGRFTNPFPQFFDSTPNVYSSGTLTFYASGTSSLQNVYTDEDLTTPASNPLTLNSAGRPAVDIFLQDLDYKVVLKDSSDNTIWTADPVSARDSKLIAKTLTGSGSPNGTVAGTAGSSTILPDFYWDYTNSVLYVCTTTGTSSTAVWTAINASSATAAVPPPQGRLTPVSATPVISSNSAVQAVYYTPYVGNLVPIYNGTSMIPTTFSELVLGLVSSHAASTIYDVFVFSNSGVLTLVTGPAWTSSTAGSCSRGSGASTTELTRIGGIYVNAVSMTGRNGSTTYTVGANSGTYLGSIFMDTTAGQVTCHVDWGQSRKWGIWNAYNRKQVFLKCGDSTASWTTAPTSWRQSRADTNNFVHVFSGLSEESYDLRFSQVAQSAVGVSTSDAQIAIGFNSTSEINGRLSQQLLTLASNGTIRTTLSAEYYAPPSLGLQKIIALEQSVNGTSNNTYYGTESYMLLSARYWA